jgi:hypothetical protein
MMKTCKIGLIALLLLLGSIMTVTSAGATCTMRGYFLRVVTFEGRTYAMFRPEPLETTSGNYYQVEVRDAQIAMAVYQAYKGGSRAYIRTTDTACNTTVTPGTNKIELGIADRIGLGY